MQLTAVGLERRLAWLVAKWFWSPMRRDEMLKAGDCVGFKAGEADGHHLQNRSDHEALVLEVGTNTPAASQSTRTSMSAAIVSDRD